MLLSDLKDLYGWKNASKFKEKYINPLIAEGLADMTVPDKPTSPNQKYYLTEKGKSLLANEIDGRYAVITSFYLGTYDDLYGGDAVLKETEYGYHYVKLVVDRMERVESELDKIKSL